MVGIGELTKQFAKEAISEQVKDVFGGGATPGQGQSGSAGESSSGPASVPASENLSALLMGQIQAMQGALKDDQELIVLATVGSTTIRTHDIFAPSPKVLVLTGADLADKTLTRIVTPADALQMVCKPAPMPPGAPKAARIRFITPQPASGGAAAKK